MRNIGLGIVAGALSFVAIVGSLAACIGMFLGMKFVAILLIAMR